jgi:hypothetical protein
MDEVAPAYTELFPFLMTHSRHRGIFTPWERRTKRRIEPVAPRGSEVPSAVENPNRRKPYAHCPCLSPDRFA